MSIPIESVPQKEKSSKSMHLISYKEQMLGSETPNKDGNEHHEIYSKFARYSQALLP